MRKYIKLNSLQGGTHLTMNTLGVDSDSSVNLSSQLEIKTHLFLTNHTF